MNAELLPTALLIVLATLVVLAIGAMVIWHDG